MKRYRPFLLLLICLTAFGLISPRRSHAISLKEEMELSRKVIALILKQYKLIEDPIVVNYVRKIGNQVAAAIPPQPYTFKFYVIEDDEYNAFATPGGYIFIYSGLIAAYEDETELAGVLAHEIAHVVCRHISQKVDRSKKISMATLAGMAAGALLGAGGAGAAGQAVSAGTAAAGQSAMLAYSREDESQADQLGLSFLVDSGYGGKGLMTGLNIIRSRQWFGSKQIPTYLSTHPASEERIAHIGSWLETNSDKSEPSVRTDPYPFQMVRARLIALYGDETIAKQKYQSAVAETPEDPMAHYGYALISARTGNRAGAIEHLRKSLEKKAFDPYILSEIGRIYYLDGKYPEAVSSLEGAVGIAPDYPEAVFYLSKTYIELGQLDKAIRLLQGVMDKPPVYNPARYALAEAYGKKGETGSSHYYLGLYYSDKKEYKNALFHLKRASETLKDPDKLKEIEKRIQKIKATRDNPDGRED